MNYYEMLNEERKKAKQKAAAYETERRAQAQQKADMVTAHYNEQRDTVRRQAQSSLDETEAAYSRLYDANAVDELVARRHAAEAIANSNLGNSGLNSTQQTALSLRRMRADADTSASRQAAIERVMQAMDEREEALRRELSSDTYAIRQEAEKDIEDERERLEGQAVIDAEERFKTQGDKVVMYVGGGSVNADRTYTPSYVTVGATAMMRQRNYGDQFASEYLHNMFSLGNISFKQWKALHDRLKIEPCKDMRFAGVAAIVRYVTKAQGERQARLFIEYLSERGTVTPGQTEQLVKEMYNVEM